VCGDESITSKSYKFPLNAEVDDDDDDDDNNNNNNLWHNDCHLKRSVQAVPGHSQREKILT